MNDKYYDKIYMRRSDTMKWVRRFKVPAKANHTSILMEGLGGLFPDTVNMSRP